MNKKLLLAIVAVIVTLAIGLPYGAFNWDTMAQYYGGTEEPVEEPAAPPSDVVEFAGNSYPFFIESGQLAIYGECDSEGICNRIALVDFSEIADGATIYDGLVTIRVFKVADGIWQINFYDGAVLIDDRTQVYVDANGLALFIVRD